MMTGAKKTKSIIEDSTSSDEKHNEKHNKSNMEYVPNSNSSSSDENAYDGEFVQNQMIIHTGDDSFVVTNSVLHNNSDQALESAMYLEDYGSEEIKEFRKVVCNGTKS